MFQVRAARPGEFAEVCFVERTGGFYTIVGPRRTWQEIEVSLHGLAMVVGELKGWGPWTHVVAVPMEQGPPALYFVR
jgi:hypothetical protein